MQATEQLFALHSLPWCSMFPTMPKQMRDHELAHHHLKEAQKSSRTVALDRRLTPSKRGTGLNMRADSLLRTKGPGPSFPNPEHPEP